MSVQTLATSIRIPPAPTPPSTSRGRIHSIDLLRGLVMIVMALDHARDFLHRDALTGDPLNLATTTPALFFTRFITHFCAPVFVFLAGTSAWLQLQRKSPAELGSFLLKRGLWLILVELSLVTLGISFDITFSVFFLQTIWAIGISMVLLGLAVRLPFAAVLGIGAIIVLGHNSLDFYEAGRQQFPVWYSFLHHQAPVPLTQGHLLFIVYPFLPWTGLMMLGYCFGRFYTHTDGAKRTKRLLLMGTALLLLFVALRYTNAYGDSQHWSVQKNALYTFLSFINVVKYPPSLLYMCVTLGPALIFLALFQEARGRMARVISVYGSVPFFYYILHFYLLHAISLLFFFGRGHSLAEGVHPKGSPFLFSVPGEGIGLPLLYVVWLGAVAALYPLCLSFSRYKKQHKQWWLSYL
jgi:uncharacterized membrane protein